MTLEDVQAIPKEFLLVSDVAEYLECDPQDLRVQAKSDREKLGFPVVMVGTRIKIPKEGFVFYMKYGRPVRMV